MKLRLLILATLFATSFSALAQTLPRPVEFYFDADSHATKSIIAVNETGEAAMERLLATIQRDPHANAEAAQLGHMAMEAGRIEVGQALYQRALGGLGSGNTLWRAAKWNYAWDLYRSGDHEAALTQWVELVTARNITGSWMPQTLAMALWSVDRKDEAVQWYAAAVRSEPDQWRGTSRYAELLPDWRDDERATLAEVQAAWKANPPSWP
ncbi:tetratricopeptide repeat protein [Marilutibacter spongiae]|uniref:Tetratricopeptide repeat protein n=1 Tax=Marilutibacter spongiae TaxID=2025720 RepID=A0A7W3Y6Z8_9GAMM|nr:tetratricopeptide repeat protein [Lysobacter spongiae]MBB1062023.1 tetratricopeptide repeat protein [Lysobacter spongiae]